VRHRTSGVLTPPGTFRLAPWTCGAGCGPASDFPYPAIPKEAQDPTGWSYDSGLGSPNVTCLAQSLIANLMETSSP